jgi:NADH-quinone oxidoreductase subunit N
MTVPMISYLLPMIAVGLTALLLMISTANRRSPSVALSICLSGILCALVLTFCSVVTHVRVTDLFVIDNYALLGMRLIFLATLVVLLFSFSYLKSKQEEVEEFYILLMISCLGALCMVASNHFISFFLGLEALSLPLYALIAYFHQRSNGLEAAIKYIVLTGVSSAFLLFGMVLIYAQLGNMRFDILAENWAPMWNSGRMILLLGLSFMMVAIFFKLNAVPFHMWAPDVYQGAPTPITAYLATVSKGAMMILFLRFFMQLHGNVVLEWQWVLSLVAVSSMLIGNWLAILQKNIKRLLAYSSIAHVGYMFVALLSGGELGGNAVLLYLTTYFSATLLAFGALILLENEQSESIFIKDVRGLFYARPALSSCLILAFLSLAGIPLTAGFMGKYWIFLAGVSQTKWVLLICLIMSSVIGLYAYLKVLISIFQIQESCVQWKKSSCIFVEFTLTALVLVTLMLGIAPNLITGIIQTAIGSL